jgi:hypothetical protein
VFNPIKTHPNGPSGIDSTEFGDSWPDAMAKINAMFHHVYHIIEGKPPVAGVKGESVLATTGATPAPAADGPAPPTIDATAHARITALEGTISDMGKKLDAALAALAAKAGPDVAKLRADAEAAEAKLAAALGPQPQSSQSTLEQAVAEAAKAAS